MFLKNDEDVEKLLMSIMPFVTAEIEDVCSYEDKTDEQREEILKVAVKSVEISVYILNRLAKDDSINEEKFNQLAGLIKENKVSEAADLLK